MYRVRPLTAQTKYSIHRKTKIQELVRVIRGAKTLYRDDSPQDFGPDLVYTVC